MTIKQCRIYFQELQETLVNLTKTLDKGGYNDTIIKQLSVADLEILDRVWDKEIQGRKEFGYPQVNILISEKVYFGEVTIFTAAQRLVLGYCRFWEDVLLRFIRRFTFCIV